jgi:hypothetical protein
MKYPSIIIFTSLLLLGCNKKEKAFDSLEYSYADTFSELFSLRFTDSDTVYVYQEWIGRNIDDSTSVIKEKTQYYGILNPHEKSDLFNYIEKINLFKYKSEYHESYLDGDAYAIAIKQDKNSKMIVVHSYNVPKEIDSISRWIYKIKKQLILKEINKQVNYKTSDSIFPPPPPPPPIENTNN